MTHKKYKLLQYYRQHQNVIYFLNPNAHEYYKFLELSFKLGTQLCYYISNKKIVV